MLFRPTAHILSEDIGLVKMESILGRWTTVEAVELLLVTVQPGLVSFILLLYSSAPTPPAFTCYQADGGYQVSSLHFFIYLISDVKPSLFH